MQIPIFRSIELKSNFFIFTISYKLESLGKLDLDLRIFSLKLDFYWFLAI